MKHIKSILSLMLIACLMLCLCACGNTEPTDGDNAATATPTVVATPTPDAPTATPEDDGKVTYTIKVVDESNTPVVGAMVQLCVDACIPGLTDANGVATFNVEEADYKVSFVKLPDGYEYTSDVTEFYYEEGSRDITLTLKKAA